jgi:hypothetical protein
VPIIEWALYNQCILRDFSPAPLRHTSTVNDYADNFAKYVLQISIASERLQIILFITGLQDPLQAMIAQHHLRMREMAAARACVREHLPSTTGNVMERRRSGSSFNYDEPFTRGHKYKHLFDITAVNNNDDDDTNVNNMMIGTDQSPVQGLPPMYLTGVVSGTGVHILVDTGSTHNIINIDVAHLLGLQKQRINTAILVGCGDEAPCRAVDFSVPLRIDADILYINAYLLDIGNNIIIGTPWLAGLRCLTWDFTTMQLQYIRNRCPFTVTTVQ